MGEVPMCALSRKYRQVAGVGAPVGTGDLLTIMATHCRDEFVAWLVADHPEIIAALAAAAGEGDDG